MTMDPQQPNETPTREAIAPLPPHPDIDAPNREAYQEKLDARLDQWQAKLEELKAKSREAKADASIEAQSALDEAKQQFVAFRDEAERFKESSKAAWQDLAQGCEESWYAFKGAAAKAKEHF